ncbi:MAG: 16S rRNA (guanine(966)-N(2))-methyltransferase RsmD [Nitrospirae bacterium]|nr:16S rRNA (guanine(966)-N(2))-methyltransferase RsmD [Nitrospirota bacterium]
MPIRILSGESKGRRLKGLGRGRIRPTSARVKTSLFDLLRTRIPGGTVLDLCAGTGSVGLEALSRGALEVTFVDRHPAALRLIRTNLESLGYRDRAQVRCAQADRFLRRCRRRFQVIFLDLPYGAAEMDPLLRLLGQGIRLEEDGLLVVEHSRRQSLPSACGNLVRFRSVRHGDTLITLYRHREVLLP